jgi:hypothetical protein
MEKTKSDYYHNWNLRNRDLAQTLEDYLMRGYQPGGFTTAVLAGDLFSAVGRADHWNRPSIAEIASAVVNTCPSAAMGSYEAVEAWCRDEDQRRSKYVTWKLLHDPIPQSVNEEVPY